MNWRRRLWLGPVVLAFAVSLVVLTNSAGSVGSSPVGNNVLTRARDLALGNAVRRPHEQMVSGGVLFSVIDSTGEWSKKLQSLARILPEHLSEPTTQGCSNVFRGTKGGPANVKVNQDCSLRRQAEEVVVVNPRNPDNLVAGQNDSRIGYNHCGYDWSLDGGKTWGDQIPPFYQFSLGDGHTADACSDPTATFDANGNAFVGGVLFDINSAASAFVVAKSNAPLDGRFYHSPVVQPQQTMHDLPLGVIASDNDPNIFNDKEFIVADSHDSSAKRDYVYGTWTRFNALTGQGITFNSPIDFSQSLDGGGTWSVPIEISGANASVCTGFSGETNGAACDQDQGSDPVVGWDGTIYVTFNNGNTPTPGINQYLIVSCPATADCSQQASWTTPSLITTDFATQPVASAPNPITGCPAGYQCLAPNGYRMGDFTAGSVSVDRDGMLYFVWADFRNGSGSCATGNDATAAPPCDNDVFTVHSTTGGQTWSQALDLTPASSIGASAQWQPWSQVTADGRVLWVGYYDREYGNCEMTGCNDITVAKIANPLASSPKTTYTRVTTSSMPNLVVANNSAQAGFLGDYMWVTVDGGGDAYVAWADTRGQQKSVEEDIYIARLNR
jgi:hypothetical protein